MKRTFIGRCPYAEGSYAPFWIGDHVTVYGPMMTRPNPWRPYLRVSWRKPFRPFVVKVIVWRWMVCYDYIRTPRWES